MGRIKANSRIKKNKGLNHKSKAIKVGSRRLRECLAIIFLALTALIILCLISYHPDDQSFSAVSTESVRVENWAGPVGAYLADFLVQLLGWVSILTPAVTFYITLILFIPSRGRRWRRVARMSGLTLIILDLACLPSTFSIQDPIFSSNAPAGGLLGQAMGNLLVEFFSRPGSIVILASLLLFGLILTTGLSLHQLGYYLGKSWSFMVVLLTGLVSKLSYKKSDIKPLRNLPRRKLASKPEIVDQSPGVRISPPKETSKQTYFNFYSEGDFKLPPVSLLTNPPLGSRRISRETLLMNSKILEKKLKDFGIDGQVTHVHPGPVITMYEYAPAPGIKVNRIVNLADDLALAMSAYSVRVIAPIPGKSVVGIEIPNPESETVYLMEILTSEEFKKSKSKLSFALGKDIFGHPVVGNLIKMPHLLIAGATGSGKSVLLNTIICSILFRATPAQVKFVLIDPKMVELMPYKDIPHLDTKVVTNPKKASWVLKNVVSEMEERYKTLSDRDAKNIESYNQIIRSEAKMGKEKQKLMPYLVIVIDELADLMMLASSDVEDSVTRLAQMARAVGIHLVLATQRPSSNVLTGVIKANLPARISFQVSSRTDSRIILDANGAQQLLGKGDMLFLPPGTSKLRRIHGPYISEVEIKKIIDYVREQASPEYDENLSKPVESRQDKQREEEADEKYEEAINLVMSTGQASISMIQRKLRVGYNRAARMVEMMEEQGIISHQDGVRPRRILSHPPQ